MKRLLLILLLLPFIVRSQTTPLTFTTIPKVQPDFAYAPDRGGNDWYNARFINLPGAASSDSSADTYWRFTWEDVQNQATGIFNFTYFDQKVQFAIDGGKKFSFGIFAYNNTAGPVVGGFTLNYPTVVHNAMQAEPVFKDVADPGCNSGGDLGNNCWVPNWNAPSYRTAYNHLIDTIIFHMKHTTYKGKLFYDILNQVDIRNFGNVGEWTGYNLADKPAAYPSNGVATAATQIQMIDDMVARFPDKQLVICTGAVLGTTVGDAPEGGDQVGYHVFTTSNSVGRIGLRRDCVGQTDNFVHDFYENNTTIFNGVKFDSAIMNTYKVAPWVGEPCSCCMVANDPLNQNMSYWDLPHQIQLYHMANFGNGNMFFQQGGSAKELDSVRKAYLFTGYRLQLTGGSMTTTLVNNTVFNVTLNWQNVGVAPVYEIWNVQYELRNGATVVWTGTSSKALRLFLPSGSATPQSDNLTLTGVTAGTYSLYLIIRDPGGYRLPLPLAITGRGSDGAYLLRSGITVSGTAPSATADAGPDQTIVLPTSTVNLTGAASTGTITSYLWTRIAGPNTPTITTPTTVTTSVTGLIQGTYVFQLSLNGGVSTDQVTITVSPTPPPVVANAGPDQSITLPTSSVNLTGAASTGTITTYSWTRISGPNTPTITTPTAVSTSVTGLIAGTYVFQLSVNGGVSTDQVTITVNPALPVANAGPDQTIVLPTSSVTLTAAASTGTITSYLWTRISGPNTPTITTPTTVTTTVTGLIVGTYVFQVSLNGGTSTDQVSITVNSAPVVTANAGPDQSITAPASTVNLTGAASINATTYSWTRVSGPNIPTITTPTAVTTSVTGLVVGVYVFQLSVNGGVSTDQVTITVNPAPLPVANAGADQTITITSVTLNGASSTGTITSYLWTRISGPNTPTITTPTTVSTTVTGLIVGTYVFQLSLNGGVSTDQVTIFVNPAPVFNGIFTTQVPTTLVLNDGSPIELGMKFRSSIAGFVTGVSFYKNTGNTGVHIGQLYSSTGTLLASATFTGETATGWQNVTFGSPVSIIPNTTYVVAYFSPNGFYTSDNNFFTTSVVNGPLTALANGTDGPNGIYLYTATPAFPTSTCVPCNGSNYWVDIIFNSTLALPVANAGVDQTITLPVNSATLSGSASTGTITSYAWTQISGPSTANITTPTLVTTNMTGLVAGTYVFQLSLNGGASTDQVSVLVNPLAVVVANAGNNQTITVPTSTASLSGSTSIGVITSYLWTQVSGPTTSTIGTPTTVNTTVSGLTQGTYIYQLSVNGGVSTAQVSIIVNGNPPGAGVLINRRNGRVKN